MPLPPNLKDARRAVNGCRTIPRAQTLRDHGRYGFPHVHAGQERYVALGDAVQHAGISAARRLYADPRSVRQWLNAPMITASILIITRAAAGLDVPAHGTAPADLRGACDRMQAATLHTYDAAPPDTDLTRAVHEAARRGAAFRRFEPDGNNWPDTTPTAEEAEWLFTSLPLAAALYLHLLHPTRTTDQDLRLTTANLIRAPLETLRDVLGYAHDPAGWDALERAHAEGHARQS